MAPKRKRACNPSDASVPLPPPAVEPQRNLKRACPVIEEADASDSCRTRRQSRTTQEKIRRFHEGKLKAWKGELDFLVGAKTKLDVDDYLGAAIDGLPEKKHLSSAFWTEFLVEFRLDSPLFTGLVNVSLDGATEASDELMDAICISKHENVTQRKVAPLVGFLYYHAGNCTKKDLMLLIDTTREQDRVCKKHAEVLQKSVLKFIGKSNLHLKWPELWVAVKDGFDVVLTRLYTASDEKHTTSRATFITAHRHALSTFMTVRHMDNIEKAIEAPSEVPAAELRELMDTIIGSKLCHPERVHLQFHDFVLSIDDRLLELEHQDFSIDETKSFDTVMHQQPRVLVHNGHVKWESKPTVIEFLGETVTYMLAALSDQWGVRRQARIREIAVSNCLVPRLPWEEIVFGRTAPIFAMTVTVRIPKEQLVDIINVRNQVITTFKAYGTLTIPEMVSISKPMMPDMRENLDKGFDVEYVWLRDICHPLLEKHYRQRILAELLVADSEMKLGSISDCIRVVNRILAEPQTASLDVVVVKDLTQVVSVLEGLNRASPPADNNIERMKSYHLQALSSCENFVTAALPRQQGHKPFGPVEEVRGRKALEILWAMWIDVGAPMATAVTFRRFRWMLTAAQKTKLDDVVNRHLKNLQVFGAVPAITDGTEKSPEALALNAPPAAASLSSSSSGPTCGGELVPAIQGMAHHPPHAPSSKGKKAQASTDDKQQMKLKFLNMFSKKSMVK